VRILQLATHLNRGGITTYVYSLSKALSERGHSVFTASSGGSCISEFDKAGIKHLTLPINTKSELSPKVWLSTRRLEKFFKKEKIDILHTHTRVAHCVGRRLYRKGAVHWLTTAHGYYKVRWGRKILPAWGERTIAISPAVKEHLLNDFKLPGEKIKMIFTGVNLEKFHPQDNEDEKTFRHKFGLNNMLTVGMIGRVSPEKGHRFFLEAAQNIGGPDVRFILVGSGRGNLQKELEPFLKDKRIIWIDYLDNLSALKLIDIFIQPSIQEGLGIALLEAMACGKVVVASNIGGIPSVIADSEDGLLVPPGDAVSLAKAILMLIKDKDFRRSLADAGRRKIEDKFDVRKMAQEIEQVYEEILK